jgi:hypothetical protein
VEIDARLNRVRLLEPQPGMPARAMPGLGQLLPRRNPLARRLILPGLLVPLGVLRLVLGPGYGYGAMLLAVAALIAFNGFRVARATAGLADLADAVFIPLALAPDGLLVAGSKVSLRLENGQWLVTRMTRQYRMLLAGTRRCWALGPDGEGRVFLQLPGSYRVHAARLRNEPASGSQLLAPILREPLPPGGDPVLAAHRRWSAGFILKTAVAYAGIAGTAFWALTDLDSAGGEFFRNAAFGVSAGAIAGGTGASVGMLLVAAVKAAWPIPPESTWLELTVRHLDPYQLTQAGTSRMTGQAALPDGRIVAFKTARIDGSLAVTAAATGQLWAITPVRFGKYVKIGLPGYPVLGSAKFSRF